MRLEKLRQKYKISYSPLREALIQLEGEKLVSSMKLKGFRVSEISVSEMWDAIETRIFIDSECVRRSIKFGGDSWEVSVLGAFHSFSKCYDRLIAEQPENADKAGTLLAERHRAFHAALIGSCNSTLLMEFSTTLYNRTEIYRRPFFAALIKQRTLNRDIFGEVAELKEAVFARKNKRSVRIISQYYRNTGAAIEKQLIKEI